MNAIIRPTVPILALPSFDINLGRHELVVDEGTSLAEMVLRSMPDFPPERYAMVRVLIEGHEVDRSYWHLVRPRAGRQVVIRVVPQKGGALRTVLSIIIVIAAIAAGQFYAPGFLIGAIGQGAASAVTTAAVSAFGNYLLNTFVPVRPADTDRKPTYSIDAFRNTANPYGPTPSLFGRLRYAPLFGAQSFSTTVGDKRYLTASFVLHGKYEITNQKIGDTPIADFGDDVEVEIKYGTSAEARLALYPSQKPETYIGQDLNRGDDEPAKAVKRNSPRDVTKIALVFYFPGGLFFQDDDGEEKSQNVDLLIQARRFGSTELVNVKELSIREKKREAFFREFEWTPPTRDGYQLHVTRKNGNSSKGSDQCQWVSLRGHRPEAPYNYTTPMTHIAVRAKGAKLTNGTLDAYNFVATRILRDWDKATGTWIERPTRSPASAWRHVHQSIESFLPKPDRIVNVAQGQDWHEWCDLKALHYDRVHDFVARQDNVLLDICQAGRAKPSNPGTKHGVIIDRPQPRVIAHITPRNSWGFSGRGEIILRPDAVRVKFNDSSGDFEPRERIVRHPNLVGEPTRIELLNIVGKTDPGEVYIEALRYLLSPEYRPETLFAMQDLESLLLNRGDRGVISHSIVDETQVAARVTAVHGRQVILDESVTMVEGASYGCRFRKSDTQSIVREVRTRPGTSTGITLIGDGPMPVEGDLAMFGLLGQETIDVILSDIENGSKLSARLSMVAHAPELDALLSTIVPPPWDGRSGVPVGETTVAPAVPVITRIDSGVDAQQGGGTAYPPVMVYLAPGDIITPVSAYEVRWRLQATTSWLSLTVSAAEAAAPIPGYAKDQILEVMALAIGATVSQLTSPFTAIMTHVVGANDPARIAAVSSVAVSITGTTAKVAYTHTNDPRAASSLVYRRREGQSFAAAVLLSVPPVYGGPNVPLVWSDTPGIGRWIYDVTVSDKAGIAVSVPASSSVVVFTGPDRIRNGGMDTDTIWGKGTGFTIGSGVATKASGATAGLDQVVDGGALEPGTYDLTWTLGGTVAGTWATRIMGGATQLSTSTRTAAGTYVDTFVVTRTDQTTARIAATSTASTGTVDNVSLRRVA